MFGDRIPVGARFSAPIQTGSEAHPASCTMGTGSFPGASRPGRGADHPPQSSAKVHRKEWSYTSTLPLEAFEAYKKGVKPKAKPYWIAAAVWKSKAHKLLYMYIFIGAT
jgi:hypothetical protein